MKTCIHKKLLGLALTGVSLLSSQAAFAAAGDPINNRAVLNYSVGGAGQTFIESAPATSGGNSTPGLNAGQDTSFVEDRVVNFSVDRGATFGSAVPGAIQQIIEFEVTNNGNGDQGFLLKAVNNTDGTIDPWGGNNDDWDTTLTQTFVEDGATPGFDTTGVEDTEAFIGTLAPGATATVYVVSTIPLTDSSANPLVTDDVAVMTLIAQVAVAGGTGVAADAIVSDDNANNSPGGNGFTNGAENVAGGVAVAANPDTSAEEIVFNDPAGTQDGTGAAGATQNGQDADDSSYHIETAELTVTKTSTAIWDFINNNDNPKAIPSPGTPGDETVVRYTILIENDAAASQSATLDNIEDVLALAMDDQFGDTGTATNDPLSGTDNVRVDHSDAAAAVFCEADNGDLNTDGCEDDFGGNALRVDLTAIGVNNTLAPGESLTVEFDVVMP